MGITKAVLEILNQLKHLINLERDKYDLQCFIGEMVENRIFLML